MSTINKEQNMKKYLFHKKCIYIYTQSIIAININIKKSVHYGIQELQFLSKQVERFGQVLKNNLLNTSFNYELYSVFINVVLRRAWTIFKI